MTGFFVGRVFFHIYTEKENVCCNECGKWLDASIAAEHARKRHRGRADGVLAGQLGLPFTNTPDVPR